MWAVPLQEWITVQGQMDVTSLTQSAHEYIDIGHHEDLALYFEVKRFTGTLTCLYETSPSQQDSLFKPMIAGVPFAVGLRVDRAFFSTAAVPPARYIRWRISASAGSAWVATFRIWVTAYSYC